MGKIFISFLGIGAADADGYKSLKYKYKDELTGKQTQFVQRAEIEAIGPATFDRIIILCTRESFKKSFHDLNDELVEVLKIDPDRISCEQIDTQLTPENQWKLFALVNGNIQDGDRLVFDFTHGFRLLSIIMSAALHFILTSKPGVALEHVFYGREDENGTEGTIVDMKDFYTINAWSDGVSRLIDGADPSRLVALVKRENSGESFSGIRNQTLIQTLQELTRVIKNIDVNHIAKKCNEALEIILEQKKTATSEEKELLDLIHQTFKPLTSPETVTGKYDRSYFDVQWNFARLLADHGLYMQSFTVMRELIASIGMLGCVKKYKDPEMNTKKGRRYRWRFGDIFFNLCQISPEKWKWLDPEKSSQITEDEMKNFKQMDAFYQLLEEKGIAANLQSFTKELSDYRNGFDHAWTGKGGSFDDVPEKADLFLTEIKQILESLKQHQIL